MFGAALMSGRQTQIDGTLSPDVATLGANALRGFIDVPPDIAGAVAPDLIDGRSLVRLYDIDSTTPLTAVVAISGFDADPGQDFLVSIKVGSITRTGGAASNYLFSGTTAEWFWFSQPFGIATSGSTNFTLKTL